MPKIGGPNNNRPQMRFVRILGDPPPYNLPRRPHDDAQQDKGNGMPSNNGGYKSTTRTEIREVIREHEATFMVVTVPVRREPAFWDGISNAIIALFGVVAVALLAIGVILAIASLVDDDNEAEDAAILALTAENAALKQQFTDYVGDCRDGYPTADVDRLRVINTRNPDGVIGEQMLIYAGCIESGDIMGGALTGKP